MNTNFPSVWVELSQQNILICGFYREWSSEGLLTIEEQLTAIKNLTKQIENAGNEHKQIIMFWDANLCSNQMGWDSIIYLNFLIGVLNRTLSMYHLVYIHELI